MDMETNEVKEITDAYLDELEGLCQKATPGPWESEPGRTTEVLEYEVWSDDGDSRSVCVAILSSRDKRWGFNEANASAIAASRTALPLLIGEVRKLRAELKDLKDDLADQAAEARWKD
jgi:hypothetical protein